MGINGVFHGYGQGFNPTLIPILNPLEIYRNLYRIRAFDKKSLTKSKRKRGI